jgi:hypothetical protein
MSERLNIEMVDIPKNGLFTAACPRLGDPKMQCAPTSPKLEHYPAYLKRRLKPALSISFNNIMVLSA